MKAYLHCALIWSVKHPMKPMCAGSCFNSRHSRTELFHLDVNTFEIGNEEANIRNMELEAFGLPLLVGPL